MITHFGTRSTRSIEADVCVIGSGAAGLSVASALLERRTRVLVLESGPRKIAVNAPDPMYEFLTADLPIAQDSRARVFGGTATRWAGRWRRLDASDFEAAPWLPH